MKNYLRSVSVWFMYYGVAWPLLMFLSAPAWAFAAAAIGGLLYIITFDG